MNKLAKKMVAGGYLTPQRIREIEKRAEQFVDELSQDPRLLMRAMTKLAAPPAPGFFGKAYSFMTDRGPDMLGYAALSALAGGIGSAAESAFRHGRDRVMKARNYNQMMEANPHLADMDSVQVQRAFNTLHKLNPYYASDPLVAGEFIKQTLGQESLNLAGLGNIVKARKDMSDSKSRSTFGPEFFAGAAGGGGHPSDHLRLQRQWDMEDRDIKQKALQHGAEEKEYNAQKAREEQRGSNENFLRAQQEHANAIEAFKAEEAKRKFWEGAEAVSPEDPRVDQ